MKREEKNALARRRITEAAMQEFSAKGYANASLNTVCAKNDISKGIIYHYFKDKDELYIFCVKECFSALARYIKTIMSSVNGTPEQKLQEYFNARLRFFADNPLYLGIFADAVFTPPPTLADKISECRKAFDDLNVTILTEFLNSQSLRKELSVPAIVEDFKIYMDFFNMRFKEAFREKADFETALHNHEERCHRQLDILLHGVLGEK